MSTRRFLSALACTCISAAPAALAGSLAELELELAQSPALYLRLDVDGGSLEVRVRGMELERFAVMSVRLAARRAPGEPGLPPVELPAVWRVVGDPQVEEWREVVAPPALKPYDEDAEPPTPVPSQERELPPQVVAALDNGWELHLGPRPPGGWADRLADRLGSGWRRLWGRGVEPPPPALAVVMTPEDSRALLHVIRDGTPLLVVCGSDGSAPTPAPTTG